MKKRDGAAPQTIALLRGSARYLRSCVLDTRGVKKQSGDGVYLNGGKRVISDCRNGCKRAWIKGK